MKVTKGPCALFVFAVASASPAFAASLYTYYPANATISSAISNNAVVGYSNDADYNNGVNPVNPTSPTVNVVPGADIADDLLAYNSSTVNVSGGAIEDGILTYNNAALTFSGGSTFSIDARNTSHVSVTGGTIPYGINLYNNSTLNISNGHIGGPIFNDGTYTGVNPQITVSGGTFDSEIDLDGGSALINGGALTDATADLHSTLTIAGATFSDDVNVYQGSSLTMTAGEIDDSLTVDAASSATISGGLIEQDVYGAGTVVIRGGTYTPNFHGYEFLDLSSTSFTFVGTGLSAVDIGPDGVGDENYLLTGILADGSSVTGDIVNVSQGSVMFALQPVPEPSSLLLLGLAGATLVTRRSAAGRRK